MIPQEYQFMQHKKTVDYRDEVFVHQSKQYMFQNQNINNKYSVFMKMRPLIGRRI